MEDINTQEEEKYTRHVIIMLDTALTKLVNQYGSDPEKTGIKGNPNGSYTITIDKGPTLWFQNEMELGEWVGAMNQSD